MFDHGAIRPADITGKYNISGPVRFNGEFKVGTGFFSFIDGVVIDKNNPVGRESAEGIVIFLEQALLYQ